MKIGKFVLGWAFISFLLLLPVILTDFIVLTIRHFVFNTSSLSNLYSVKDMLLGTVSESLRALLLCCLFPQIKKAGISFLHAIRFGLIISALIGTMWLIIGYGSFILKNPNAFFISDTIILALQGILSGIGLQILYKKNFI
ncbi:MAG TPA: hypothetical protein VN026_02380 [Bacteroidia bacterium]|jgi:hypothetical protein|nr:hypothetical protein [Bacteroidia bacterium]